MSDLSSKALKPGDCGAWAIDSSTDEVYGHVVASDAFGEAYVIPLGATFKDIEHQLGAEAVYLPRGRELPNLHCEQEVMGNSASTTISPCSDSSLEGLPTDATELTDFSLFEPFHRYGKDQSSTSTSPKRHEHDANQQSWKWWEHPSNEFETFEMSHDMPESDVDKPLPDSGYASNQTSQPNSPESPLNGPPVTVLFNPTDDLSPSHLFDATDHHSASQFSISTEFPEFTENSHREPPAHPPLTYTEYRESLPVQVSRDTKDINGAQQAPLSNTSRARTKFHRREKIKSWFRRYVVRKEDPSWNRPISTVDSVFSSPRQHREGV